MPSVRVRSNDVLLAAGGVLFVFYPAIRPCSDETVAPGRCGLRLLRLDRRPRTQPKLWRPRVPAGRDVLSRACGKVLRSARRVRVLFPRGLKLENECAGSESNPIAQTGPGFGMRPGRTTWHQRGSPITAWGGARGTSVFECHHSDGVTDSATRCRCSRASGRRFDTGLFIIHAKSARRSLLEYD